MAVKSKPGNLSVEARDDNAHSITTTAVAWNSGKRNIKNRHPIQIPDCVQSGVNTDYLSWTCEWKHLKCGGKKTSHNWKPSYKTEVSAVTIWTLEGCKSSAKTVDPQLHFKGMEVWKQSHEKNTPKTKGSCVLEDVTGNKTKLKSEYLVKLKPKLKC